MNCAILQPHYLPWIGYFYLINSVDYFIFLDDVKFSHQSWQNRNQILLNNKKVKILSIPVNFKENDYIDQVKIDDSKNWRKKHVNTIVQNYSKHPYFKDLNIIIDCINDLNLKKLSTLNIFIIKKICDKLSLNTNFIISSSLSIEGKRTEKLIKILKTFNCKKYFSNSGANKYLVEDQFEKKSNIELILNKKSFVNYQQYKNINFVSNLSFIDILANLGFEGFKKYLEEQKLNK